MDCNPPPSVPPRRRARSEARLAAPRRPIRAHDVPARARARAFDALHRASHAPYRHAALAESRRATSPVRRAHARPPRDTSVLVTQSLGPVRRILLVSLDNLGDLVFASALTPPLHD